MYNERTRGKGWGTQLPVTSGHREGCYLWATDIARCVCNVPTVGLLRLTQEYQLMDFVEIGKLDVS